MNILVGISKSAVINIYDPNRKPHLVETYIRTLYLFSIVVNYKKIEIQKRMLILKRSRDIKVAVIKLLTSYFQLKI